MTTTALTDEWVGLPAAAAFLGLHRATVNEMVKEGRIAARREGAHWYIRATDLASFKDSYQRPRNSPRRKHRRESLNETAVEIIELLRDWGEATVGELSEVLQVHDGNVRKNLTILETRGLTQRSDDGLWRLTDRGERRHAVVDERA